MADGESSRTGSCDFCLRKYVFSSSVSEGSDILVLSDLESRILRLGTGMEARKYVLKNETSRLFSTQKIKYYAAIL